MNLQENIHRIKEVMGINENRDFMFFKRRENELMEYLISLQKVLDSEFLTTFEEYRNTLIDAAWIHFFESPDTAPEQTKENIIMLKAMLNRLLDSNDELLNNMKDNYEQSHSYKEFDY